MAYYSHTATFDKGEISPLLGARSDVDFWASSLFKCRNFNALTHGGIRRRSGSRFIAEVADSNAPSRLIPFIFNDDQSYVLEFSGNGQLRFLAQRGLLYSGAYPYSITHSYSGKDLRRINFVQFNDVAYMAHKEVFPATLKRKGDINWSLEEAKFDDGPYLTPNDTTNTLSLNGDGAIPVFQSGSSDAANGGFVEFTVIDAPKVMDNYYITAVSHDYVGENPNGWELVGWDGAKWVFIDRVEGESGWARSKRFYYKTSNKRAFSKYRFNFIGPQGTGVDDNKITWGPIKLHWRGENQGAYILTMSSTENINSGSGFTVQDIGRSIRIRVTSTIYAWLKVVAHISATSVWVQINNQIIDNYTAIQDWALSAVNRYDGIPRAVTLYDERLFWAGVNHSPARVFASKQGAFDNYGISEPVVDTDGINMELLSSQMNPIEWLSDDMDLIAGSSRQLRAIGKADATSSFSATNFEQKKAPSSGSDYIQPLSVGGVTLYAGIGGTKIRELVLGDQNRYVAPELSLLGEHHFKSGIKDWVFCERPDPTIYSAMGDGSLVATTYDREQKVVGFSRYEIANGFVESVAVTPSVHDGYDDVYMVVRRVINGQTRRYIEVLERPFDGDIDSIEDAFHVDSGLSYTGAPITVITGLNHLEGETVVALADGNVVRNLVVSGGAVTLPYASSKISVGLAFKSLAITLPVAGPQQDGTLFGRNRTVISASIDVLSSAAAKVGAYGSDEWCPELHEQLLKTGETLFGNKLELRTGIIPCDIQGSWMQGGGQVVIETDEPVPLLVRALVLQLESTP
ncbi:hypothetical protein K1X45_00050 [Pseudochrobactrum sp. Wa41.01b-1]|uniref:hypothetical protein n=1 Tax=Pseudochrobactrum sp. Wa41.01b-1 TaxID=2864102 RepID=UPI001C693BDE|nr:hypothetical protein [Pseudochrobactrum sp. Wa41.01b-1]QYM72909.1 hypothetical protein K1X45_00050 [Pseudochrobactrum sp. Wa41.01b-1]